MSCAEGRRKPSQPTEESRISSNSDLHDLFKYTRARLIDVSYEHTDRGKFWHLTNDEIRRQILRTIFGWHKEVEDLIREEKNRHPAGSISRMLLAKWLGDGDAKEMVADERNMTSSGWMLLVMSGLAGQTSDHRLLSYVSTLRESRETHAAVTLLLSVGDFSDAINAYLDRDHYLEALILACLKFPDIWVHQANIVRQWGEWAAQHDQEKLAIRCFACTTSVVGPVGRPRTTEEVTIILDRRESRNKLCRGSNHSHGVSRRASSSQDISDEGCRPQRAAIAIPKMIDCTSPTNTSDHMRQGFYLDIVPDTASDDVTENVAPEESVSAPTRIDLPAQHGDHSRRTSTPNPPPGSMCPRSRTHRGLRTPPAAAYPRNRHRQNAALQSETICIWLDVEEVAPPAAEPETLPSPGGGRRSVARLITTAKVHLRPLVQRER